MLVVFVFVFNLSGGDMAKRKQKTSVKTHLFVIDEVMAEEFKMIVDFLVTSRGGCWLWPGLVNEAGYGVFKYEDANFAAHRVAETIARGPIPQGLYVLHSCDIPACVRPDHLRTGTAQENYDDQVDRDRRPVIKGRLWG